MARTAVGSRAKTVGVGSVVRWLGLPFDRRVLAIVLAIGLLAALLGGALLVGARLLLPPLLPADAAISLAYAIDDDIFVADWDGTNPIRIADGDLGGPVWSASGGM